MNLTNNDHWDPLPLHLVQSVPNKRTDNRATTDMHVKGTSTHWMSKDDNDIEGDFDIQFMDEDVEINWSIQHRIRAPKKMVTYFQPPKKADLNEIESDC